MKKTPFTVAGTLLLMSAASSLALANHISATALSSASLGRGKSEPTVNNLMKEYTLVPPGAYVAAAHDRPDTIGDLSGLGDEKGWGKFLDRNSPDSAMPDVSTENSSAVAAAVAVPEAGTTALLVGMAVIGMTAVVRRRETTV